MLWTIPPSRGSHSISIISKSLEAATVPSLISELAEISSDSGAVNKEIIVKKATSSPGVILPLIISAPPIQRIITKRSFEARSAAEPVKIENFAESSTLSRNEDSADVHLPAK